MSEKSSHVGWQQSQLILMPEQSQLRREPKFKAIEHPIWTENKARLIERYLYYFVLITKHGTYIDGFAGPQRPDKIEAWAAKLVLESQPQWLRHLYLFDKDNKQIQHLHTLKRLHPDRDIQICQGDFNVRVLDLLRSGSITQNEATFCLLDQRTFECHWSSLEALARYKASGHKIELFYFFPNAWLDRALAAQQDTGVLEKWWGQDNWELLRHMRSSERATVVCERIKREFGYRSVLPWPIYEHQLHGNVMYYMIHATDHNAAPEQMFRAYHDAITPKEQLSLGFRDRSRLRPNEDSTRRVELQT